MLDWFTTIPGILIICGVILLVIAIILFAVGAKKSKKEGLANAQSMDEKPVESMPTTDTVVNPTPVEPVTVESVNPSVDVTTANVGDSITIEEPVSVSEPQPVDVSVTGIMNEQPVVDIPSAINEQPIMDTPNVIGEQPVVDTPVMDISSASEIPTVEDNNSVYGGETPVVNFSINEEKPVTIYGGNDPLEATQTLPKVEEHHEPYGGIYPEARVVDPIQPVEMPTSVEDVIPAMPIEEPVVEMPTVEQPVINIPDVEPAVASTPVVEPEIASIPEVETPEVSSMNVEPTPVTVPVPEEAKSTVEEL